MQILPVNYNYTNQKVQKNNSNPAFGAMTTAMHSFVAAHIREIAEAGRRGDQLLLDAMEIIRTYPNLVHYRECIGFQAEGKFVMERGSFIDNLKQFAEAIAGKKLKPVAVVIKDNKPRPRDLPHQNTLMKAFLEGRLKTVNDCLNI